jgi:hypothetical protein
MRVSYTLRFRHPLRHRVLALTLLRAYARTSAAGLRSGKTDNRSTRVRSYETVRNPTRLASRYNFDLAIHHRPQLSADFQGILLSFFGQEIVAHSATLFAALGSAFFFIHYLRPDSRRHFTWRIAFSIIAALLLTGAIYSVFRIICYGQLAFIAMADRSIDVSSYSRLSQYYDAIIAVAKQRASVQPLYAIAWIFYFPQGIALVPALLIWIFLALIICCLLFQPMNGAPGPESTAVNDDRVQRTEQRPTTGRNTSDDEAKFLIDQFNKLASWRMSGLHLAFSTYGPLAAAIAIFVSILTITWRNTALDVISNIYAPGLAIGIAIFVAALWYDYRRAGKIQEDDGNRLLALEAYYSKFKSLPNLTLARILEFTPKDLEKFLRDNEPKGSPQT